MVAGPYSAPTEEERRANLEKLNRIAYQVFGLGHVPVVGVNAALPIVRAGEVGDPYETIMTISLALADRCDALLLVASSPGADREAARIQARGLPVYRSLDAIPRA